MMAFSRTGRQAIARQPVDMVALVRQAVEELFEFVKNPDVEGTNNAAERALRKAVVARKVSGGSRSAGGAKNYAILLSVWETLKQKGIDLLSGGPALIWPSRG